MVPKIARGGRSFKAAMRYYLHDKGADTSHRVDWIQTENMFTTDPAKAANVMAFTAKAQERLKEASGQSRAGRKLENPVFSFSLAWHPEQLPTKDHMLATARQAIAMLKLDEHEAVIVAHKDEPQKHVHVIVNRVHPLTGLAGDVRNSKRKFSDFAREYEQTHGKIYCERREANHQKRKEGQPTRYCDPAIVEAWDHSQSGREFVAALSAKGYRLAHGRKRLVVIDPHGKALNPLRNLHGVRPFEFQARLKDLDLDRIPDANVAFSKSQEISPSQKKGRWSPRQIAKMQADQAEKHRQEYEAAQLQRARQFQVAKKTLAAYYDLLNKKKELIQLKSKIDRAPWWKRLLGFTRKDRKTFRRELVAYNATLAQYRQKIDRIKEEGRTSLSDLRNRQEKERMSLKLNLDWQNAQDVRRAKITPRQQTPSVERGSRPAGRQREP